MGFYTKLTLFAGLVVGIKTVMFDLKATGKPIPPPFKRLGMLDSVLYYAMHCRCADWFVTCVARSGL